MADTHTRAALRREIERATKERERLDVVISYLMDRYEALVPAPATETTGKQPQRRAAKSTRVLPLKTSIAALKAHNAPLSTSDLADAIRSEGGHVTSLDNLYRSLKRGRGVVRVGRGLWGLAEWYPNGVPTEDSSRSNGAEGSGSNQLFTGAATREAEGEDV